MKQISLLSICALMFVFVGCSHYIPNWTATYSSNGEILPTFAKLPAGYVYDDIVPAYINVPEKPVLVKENGRTTASITLENAPFQAVGVLYNFQWLDKNGQVVDAGNEDDPEFTSIPAGKRKALRANCNDSDATDWRLFIELLH